MSKPSGISITKAVFDGSKLDVAATSSVGYPLEVVGLGSLAAPTTAGEPAEASFAVKAPPASITVKHAAGNSASLAVTVAGGAATDPGLDPLVPAADPGPVTETGSGGGSTGGTGTEPLTATVTASSATAIRGASVQLDGRSSTGEVGYQWSQVSGPTVALSSETAANPTVTVPYWANTQDAQPKVSPDAGPAKIKLVTTGGDGATKEAFFDLAIQNDTVAIDAGSRHRRGTELRVSGTSTLAGNTAILNPATTIVIWNMSGTAPVKIGTAQVDTLGAWSYKIKPGPAPAGHPRHGPVQQGRYRDGVHRHALTPTSITSCRQHKPWGPDRNADEAPRHGQSHRARTAGGRRQTNGPSLPGPEPSAFWPARAPH